MCHSDQVLRSFYKPQIKFSGIKDNLQGFVTSLGKFVLFVCRKSCLYFSGGKKEGKVKKMLNMGNCCVFSVKQKYYLFYIYFLSYFSEYPAFSDNRCILHYLVEGGMVASAKTLCFSMLPVNE